MEDCLSLIRDNFFAGYYARCLEFSTSLSYNFDELDRAELQSLILRARAVLNRDRSATPGPTHTEISTIATIDAIDFWYCDTEVQRTLHLEDLKAKASTHDPIAKFLAAAALCAPGPGYDPVEALRLSANGPIEIKALRVMQMLIVNRPDLGTELAKSLSVQNDDAVLTKLATAATSIANGNYQEAYLTYGDIQIQCCQGEEVDTKQSVLLLNGKAVANMMRKHWGEAYEDLLIAYKQDPRDSDTLANLVSCSQWLNKDEDVKTYLGLLSDIYPEHVLNTQMKNITVAFEKFKASHAQ